MLDDSKGMFAHSVAVGGIRRNKTHDLREFRYKPVQISKFQQRAQCGRHIPPFIENLIEDPGFPGGRLRDFKCLRTPVCQLFQIPQTYGDGIPLGKMKHARDRGD